MKQITVLLIFALLVGCGHMPKPPPDQEGNLDGGGSSSSNGNTVTDAPMIEGDEGKAAPQAAAKKDDDAPAAEAAPTEKPKPVASSQYSALNEGIKQQNDEKIYAAATQILGQSGNDARALNALAMYHYKRQRFGLSRYLLSKGIAANPRMAELYTNLGIVQLAQGERREGTMSFRKALSIDSGESVAAANLGAIFTQEKDFNKAVLVLETAYSKGLRDPRVLNNYGVALTATGNYEKAADVYKAALKTDSGNKDVMYNYAILLVEHTSKYQEALDVINRLKFVGGPADTRNKIIALENKAKAGLK